MATIIKRDDNQGAVTWQAKIRLNGYPPTSRTFKRLTDAKRWAAETETAIRQRRYFRSIEAEKHTLQDLCEQYITDVLPGKKGEKKQTTHLRWWTDRIGSHALIDVTPALIARTRDKLARTPTARGPVTSAGTVNRYLATLSRAFTIAVREWGWVEDNPLRKVSRLTEPRGRVRFLSDIERDRLLEACAASRNQDLYPVVVLALSTGMRDMEIRGLTWDRVDLKRRRLVLEETKNGERRVIPLTRHTHELLKQRAGVRRLDTTLLFSSPHDPLRPRFMRPAFLEALERAGIHDFRFHDLRHSCASYLAMNGASLAEIAEVLGHKTLAMVKRYAHLSEAHTAGVVERMNERIFGAAAE